MLSNTVEPSRAVAGAYNQGNEVDAVSIDRVLVVNRDLGDSKQFRPSALCLGDHLVRQYDRCITRRKVVPQFKDDPELLVVRQMV